MLGSNGGIIGPENAPTSTVASGMWTIGEVFSHILAGNWPTTQEISMPYNQGGVIGVNNPTAAGPGSTTEKITSFPASGTFTSQAGQTVADIFLLAGGGSGISGGGGTGGGGAGGAVKVAAHPISAATAYPISIGAGGIYPSPATTGSDTTGFDLTAKGGGAGNRGPGGCGGGGQEGDNPGGPATQPAQPGVSGSSGLGNNGGTGGPQARGAGGGGIGGTGQNGSGPMAGGPGSPIDYGSPTASPSGTTYGGGGGGCANARQGGPHAPGGGGGGGAGDAGATQNPPNDGVQGLGAGGGSAYAGQGIGDGGDGFAVVRETAVSFQGSGTGMFRLRTQYDRIVAGTWPSA